MEKIYEAYIQKAKEQIFNSSEKELYAENFEGKVFEKSRIETPYLDKPKASVSIDEEIIGFHNAPSNISFTLEKKWSTLYLKHQLLETLSYLHIFYMSNFLIEGENMLREIL